MSTAQQRRKKTRAQRQAQQAKTTQNAQSSQPQSKRKAPRSRASWWLWGGFAALIVAVIVAFFVIQNLNQSNGTNSTISGVQTYTGLARDHVTGPVKYAQNPPVGGPHNPVWLNCGIYTSPVPNENAVHAMEHGAVWITYQPSLSASDVSQLQSIVHGHTYVVLSPYPNLPAPIVLSAWGVQLKVNSVSDPRIDQFISTYEQGPQTPEQGAACSGGVGTPSVP